MANKVVQLNVGGQLFTTTVATLSSPVATGSMLAKLVDLHLTSDDSDNNNNSMQPTLVDPRHPGALFLDRDGALFSYILDYLRNGGELVPPDDLCTTKRLLDEAQFYQLQGLTEQLQAHARMLQCRADRLELEKQQTERRWSAFRSEVVQAVGKLEDLLDTHRTSTKEALGAQNSKLDSIDDSLSSLDRYLSPHRAYHTGKRGGPNFNRPRKLLEDLEEILAESKS